MKKVLLGLVALSAVAMAGEVGKMNLYPKVGLDLMATYQDYKTTYVNMVGETKGLGYEFAVEMTYGVTTSYELGLGVGYQIHAPHAEVKDGESTSIEANPSYNSIPVYLTNIYSFGNFSGLRPFVKLDVGYSINSLEKNGSRDGEEWDSSKYDGTPVTNFEGTTKEEYSYTSGLYYGIGAGVELKNFVIDIMYKVNSASLTHKYSTTSPYDSIYDTNETSTTPQNYSRIALNLGYRFSF
ncbi:MAG: hypothetical protein ACRCSK_05855 [Fusobacteriaceae bacterium]